MICLVGYCNDRTNTRPGRGGKRAAGSRRNGRHVSRGRPPSNGIRDALPIARARGRVMEIVLKGSTPARFVVVVDNRVIFVTLRRADPFRMTRQRLSPGTVRCSRWYDRFPAARISSRSSGSTPGRVHSASSAWRTRGCSRSAGTGCRLQFRKGSQRWRRAGRKPEQEDMYELFPWKIPVKCPEHS